MNIEEFFDQVQELVKTKLEHPDDIKKVVEYLNDDNIQAVINQNFNSKKTVEETADAVYDSYTKGVKSEVVAKNKFQGDRSENTMENVISFNEFKYIKNINE